MFLLLSIIFNNKDNIPLNITRTGSILFFATILPPVKTGGYLYNFIKNFKFAVWHPFGIIRR